MPRDGGELTLEQRVTALLVTPEPLKVWLRTQPPDESAGICVAPLSCVLARFLEHQLGILVSIGVGQPPRSHGTVEPVTPPDFLVIMPEWADRLATWFDRSSSIDEPGPTHAEVLAYLEA